MTSPAEKERRTLKEQRRGSVAAPANYLNRKARRAAAKVGVLEACYNLGLPLGVGGLDNLDAERRAKAQAAKEK